MGMDVTGNSGNYFRNNVWWWRPLADYCQMVAPEITDACELWHTNDGDGLDGPHARALAAILRQNIRLGLTARYEKAYDERRKAVPDESCKYCNGTGVRDDDIGHRYHMPDKIITAAEHGDDHPRLNQKGWCNGCNGKGHVRPMSTAYPFSVENVEEFAVFLEQSDGFQIW